MPSLMFPQHFEHPCTETSCPVLKLLLSKKKKGYYCLFPPLHGEFLKTREFLLDGWTSQLEKSPAKFLGDCTVQCY